MFQCIYRRASLVVSSFEFLLIEKCLNLAAPIRITTAVTYSASWFVWTVNFSCCCKNYTKNHFMRDKCNSRSQHEQIVFGSPSLFPICTRSLDTNRFHFSFLTFRKDFSSIKCFFIFWMSFNFLLVGILKLFTLITVPLCQISAIVQNLYLL